MKTKKIYKYVLVAALIAPLTLTSCSDDFLDVTPPDKATLEEYYSTYDHVMEAVVSTYNPMREYDWNNNQYAPLTMCSDVMADDVWVGGGTSSDNQHLQKMANYASTENSGDALTGIWDQSYKGVRNANDVLTYLEWAKANMTQAQYNTLEEEARVLRAFYYMQLWKFYGNIPFYMENLKAPYIGEQKSADEVYNNVISDLESAIALNALPMQWDDSNIGRVNQATAYMIYAEMVMYQNDESRYSKALGYMREIINDTEDYDLNPDYANIFLESGEWTKESIFEICYKDDGAVRAWGGGYVNAGGTIYPRLISPRDFKGDDGVDNGWGFEPVRLETAELFDEGDTRKDATIYDATGKDYNTKSWQNTGLWLKKYLAYKENNKDQKADGDLNFNNNLRIYRFAETLLNAAELIVRTNGDQAEAEGYLNKVHHRAGLTDNKAATIDNIIDERHKEFVGEGKRYWDLIRTGKASTVLVPDAYGYRTNSWTAKKKYLPIPLSELDAAQGTLTQNDY